MSADSPTYCSFGARVFLEERSVQPGRMRLLLSLRLTQSGMARMAPNAQIKAPINE